MSSTIPVFPLPGVFLFPGQILPLHVFEMRYRQMIEDMLDGPGRLAIATILAHQDEADPDQPALLPVAGLGEIARHKRLSDGRFSILVFGLTRVRISEVPSDRRYRQVHWEPWRDTPPSEESEQHLKPALVGAIQRRTGFAGEQLDQASTARLTDVLAQCLAIPAAQMESLFSEPEVSDRAARLLAFHEQTLPRETTE